MSEEIQVTVVDGDPIVVTISEGVIDHLLQEEPHPGKYASSEDLAAETAARVALGGDLASEIADRMADVDQEEAARIQAVLAESNARVSADNALGSRIDQEVLDRIAGDETGGDALTDEVAARIAGDDALGVRIDAEEEERIDADALLSAALVQEVSDREDADTALGARVDEEVLDRVAGDSALEASLDAEIAARIADVNTEETARISAVSALTSALDQEISDRVADVNTEETARIAAVTAETNARIAADQTLTDNLAAEVAARTADVDAEEAARIAAINAHTALPNAHHVQLHALDDTDHHSGSIDAGQHPVIASGDLHPEYRQKAVAIVTADIAADAVTWAKIQNMTADRLLGRDTGGSGDVEEISVGGGLEWTGSGGIQRGALTGDVTSAAGSGATMLAAGDAGVLNTGTLLATRMPALTGEVTSSVGTVATVVEAVHSGSSHAAIQTAASDALASHAADEELHGGEVDTSNFALKNSANAFTAAPQSVTTTVDGFSTSVSIQNLSAGTSARSNFRALSDTGVTVDFGLSSSGHGDDSVAPGPLWGFIRSSSGAGGLAMIIGSSGAGKDIAFRAGTKGYMRIFGSGTVAEAGRISVGGVAGGSGVVPTPLGRLSIWSTVASEIGLTISGFTSQTGDLTRWLDSAGTILVSVDAAGKLVWGPTGNQDTNLYRSAANILKTDDALEVVGAISEGGSLLTAKYGQLAVGNTWALAQTFTSGLLSTGAAAVERSTATSTALAAKVTGDANQRIIVRADGQLLWGSGAGAGDVSMNREAANILSMSHSLRLGASGSALYFGTNDNTRIVLAAGALTFFTNNVNTFNFQANGDFKIVSATARIIAANAEYNARLTVEPGAAGTKGIVVRGLASQSGNLIEAQAEGGTALWSLLSTGGQLANPALGTTMIFRSRITGESNDIFYMRGSGEFNWGGGGASGVDTNLYRSAANILKTDDAFYAAGIVRGGEGTTRVVAIGDIGVNAPGILFGNTQDVNLYRSAADVLKTDDKMHVVGELELDGAFNHDGASFGALGVNPAAQRAHVVDPSGGATVDAEARTAINAILVTLETFGFHAAA